MVRSIRLRRLARGAGLCVGIVWLLGSCSGSMILLSSGAENVEKITVKKNTGIEKTVEITDPEEILKICSWFEGVRLSTPPEPTFLEKWNSMGSTSSCRSWYWYFVTIHPEPKLIGDDEPYTFGVGRTTVCDDSPTDYDQYAVGMDGKRGRLETEEPVEYFDSLFIE